MGIAVPPNQVVSAFLPKRLNQRIPDVVEYYGAKSISELVRVLVERAIDEMDAAKAKEQEALLRGEQSSEVRAR
jgi:metal-responsive CopG/Arc/MetJ family transcriptional regulator